MYRLFLIVALFSCMSLAGAADSYLCTADQATGFQFNSENGEWEQVQFVPRARYIIKKSTDSDAVYSTDEGYFWAVTDFAGGESRMGCKVDFTSTGTLFCDGFVGDVFLMNNKSMRYAFTYVGSYVESSLDFSDRENIKNGPDRGGDTPTVEIGTCNTS